MHFRFSDLWDWRGTVGRGKYLTIGLLLFALKHNIDRLVAAASFNRHWTVFNYWLFPEAGSVETTPPDYQKFYATLLLIALPFIWTGVVLTLRRLRSAGLPLWLVLVFFVPFVNLLFFILLGVLPPRTPDAGARPRPTGRLKPFLDQVIPRGAVGSALFGVLMVTLLTVAATVWSVNGLGNYGWGLFVGLPFCVGLASVLVYGYHESRALKSCLLVSLLSIVLTCAAIIAFAIEGLICIIMAAPLGALFALFGGFMGYLIQHRDEGLPASHGSYNTHAFAVVLLALPALMLLENSMRLQSPLRAVRTSVEINAPPESVWPKLVAFTELPPPQELLFRTGIAYPVRAEIEGRGVGAVRHCVFSTGAFVEPIEVWDAPRQLKFGVTAQPPIMDELSPYPHLSPPHLNNYLQSRRGQFLLTPLEGGSRTLLEGTTWYENNFWPGVYWNRWSDYIIGRIHARVLDHIKHLAEQERREPARAAHDLVSIPRSGKETR
ncbi:MAG TPA: hypothetical protein VF703_15630 [Pyrinomonadaceae bacterium]|jgi:uncharacterized membrane protein YhaH (DUF805 family)